MHFTVEEENLICMYHNADRRRTIGKITAAMPGMDSGICGRLRPASFLFACSYAFRTQY
ncbi:MAG: transposon-transfer assisting family protein [Blautia faecis]